MSFRRCSGKASAHFRTPLLHQEGLGMIQACAFENFVNGDERVFAGGINLIDLLQRRIPVL